MRKIKDILLIFIVLLSLGSCVTPKVHNNLLSNYSELKSDFNKNEKNILNLKNTLEKEIAKTELLLNKINNLSADSVQNGKMLAILQEKYNSLSETYDLLVSKNSRLISDKAKETKNLLERLQKVQSDLLQKEEQLNDLSNSLLNKEENLKLAKEELDLRSKRVLELEKIINTKDSLVSSLKKTISNALIGLEGEGLSIEQRNGKVYISLEEELLFASGQYEVNTTGIEALNRLSVVLANQDNLEILVEGHTDSIPLSGKGLIKDNWDLSVMRSTQVVKVLTRNKDLSPLKVIAAGRAQFMPIETNKTIEGRSANRRIEMILSPKLNDLFYLLD